jgi:hypothetical protein
MTKCPRTPARGTHFARRTMTPTNPAKCLTKEALAAVHNRSAEVDNDPLAIGTYGRLGLILPLWRLRGRFVEMR